VRKFLSPLLKSRMQCVSVLLPCNCLQICKTLLLSQISFVDGMLCLFPTVITWFVFATNQFEQCDQVCTNPFDEIVIFIFFVKHSEGTWFAQFLWVLWSLMSG
jgi:hypothetical protein